QRVELRRGEPTQARPLYPPWRQYSDETRKELEVLQAAARCRRRYGPRAIEQTIVSHTETLSDLLEVLVLQQETGLLRPDAQRSTPRRRADPRSEEHTSELQSRENLVCR